MLVEKINQFTINEENRKLLHSLSKRVSVKGFKVVDENRFLIHSCEEMVQKDPKKKPKLREIYIFNDTIIHLSKNSSTKNSDSVLDPKMCQLPSKSDQVISLCYSNWSSTRMFAIQTNNPKNFKTLFNYLEKVIKKNRKCVFFIKKSSSFFQFKDQDVTIIKQNLSCIDPTNCLKCCCLVEKELWAIRDNSKISVLKNKAFNNVFSSPQNVFTCICFNGKKVFFSTEKGEIIAYDHKTHIVVSSYSNFHSSKINHLLYLQKENIFVSSDQIGVLCFWKFEDCQFSFLKKLDSLQIPVLLYQFIEGDSTNLVITTFEQKSNKTFLFKIKHFSKIETLEITKFGSVDGMINSLCYCDGNLWLALEQNIAIYEFSTFIQVSVLNNPHKRIMIDFINQINGF